MVHMTKYPLFDLINTLIESPGQSEKEIPIFYYIARLWSIDWCLLYAAWTQKGIYIAARIKIFLVKSDKLFARLCIFQYEYSSMYPNT